MTYADQLSILSESVKLKREKADKALLRLQKGFKNIKVLHRYLDLEQEHFAEHIYYTNFFIYCLRNQIDFDIESEFKTI